MEKIEMPVAPEYFHKYINQVSSPDLHTAFQLHQTDLLSLLEGMDTDKWDYRYEKDKWTVKELVQHIIDSERVFAYRALCIARKEKQSLPSFDEKTYGAASKADKRKPEDLMEELGLVQKSTVCLFASFDKEQLNEVGSANNNPVSVEALGYIIVGHVLHHKKILLERYL
jgi:hypothetical protein